MSRLLDGEDDRELAAEITSLVQEHFGTINWEIGPDGRSKMFCFAINGKAELLRMTEAIIAQAPGIKGWRFHAAKPSRPVPPLINFLAGSKVQAIDATGWRFALRGSDANRRCDVLVLSGHRRAEMPEQAALAAILLVEMAVGEREFVAGIRDVILLASDDEIVTRISTSHPLKSLPRTYAKRKLH